MSTDAAAASAPHRDAGASPLTVSPLTVSPATARTATGVLRATHEPVNNGLRVTIDDLSSIAIEPEEPLELSGVVSNTGDLRWRDAQVYLTMTAEPAISKSGLDAFTSIEGGFGSPVERLGLFDEIGAVRPGEPKPYSLSVPFRQLPINQTPGVYHVGVIVLASNRDGRDAVADARADTVMPLLPEAAAGAKPVRTNLLTLLPLSALVSRHADGAFTDDSLAAAVSEGGRLRNVLDFAASAPANTLDLVVDPAVLDACQDIAGGYVIRTGRGQGAIDTEGDADSRGAAADWLADLETIAQRQGMTLSPWGSPASSALADAEIPAVIEAAVLAGQTFAAEANLSAAITNWPIKGLTTRAGLARTRSAGAVVSVVSQLSLPALRDNALDPDRYPPAQVTLGTVDGPLTALVTRRDIGGVTFTSRVDLLELRQAVAAEATVRALNSSRAQTSVLAAPSNWNPASNASAQFGSLYDFATVSPTSLPDAQIVSAPYAGPVRLPKNAPSGFPAELVESIAGLRSAGRVFVDLFTEQRRVSLEFDRELASAGSAWWQQHPNRATWLNTSSKRDKVAQVGKVTIAGASFVTLSSESGRFPLTVTNGLDISVTVIVEVVAQDPAFQIEPLKPIVLEPGRQRDVEVVTRAEGSGLTAVRARLSTANERPFGRPVNFDLRATQIGLLIWVVFALAASVIVVASGLRIYRRVRTAGFRPRGEQPT